MRSFIFNLKDFVVIRIFQFCIQVYSVIVKVFGEDVTVALRWYSGLNLSISASYMDDVEERQPVRPKTGLFRVTLYFSQL
jgi:hypothetical protein